jgi:hypothetical protein
MRIIAASRLCLGPLRPEPTISPGAVTDGGGEIQDHHYPERAVVLQPRNLQRTSDTTDYKRSTNSFRGVRYRVPVLQFYPDAVRIAVRHSSLAGFLPAGSRITDDDVEPYSHCVPEPAKRLDVGRSDRAPAGGPRLRRRAS